MRKVILQGDRSFGDAYELRFRDAKTFDKGAVLLTYLS
jgi:hypothetical protein